MHAGSVCPCSGVGRPERRSRITAAAQVLLHASLATFITGSDIDMDPTDVEDVFDDDGKLLCEHDLHVTMDMLAEGQRACKCQACL